LVDDSVALSNSDVLQDLLYREYYLRGLCTRRLMSVADQKHVT